MDVIEGINGAMPQLGDRAARMLTPTLLEVAMVNTKPMGGAFSTWNFVGAENTFVPPAGASCVVEVDGVPVAHTFAGFRRRALYAPLAVRDLRIDNRMFIQLAAPVSEGAVVTLTTSGWEGEGSSATYTAGFSASQRSAAVHANQEGYQTAGPKQGMIGYYLGSLGELPVSAATFSLVDEATGLPVHTGNLTLKPDVGYAYNPTPYQQVKMADFSTFQTPGVYRIEVPGLGRSLPFRISDDMLMNFVRTYAQGLYNQRCGHAVELPYSRHTHAACHTATAGIPTSAPEFNSTWGSISAANAGTPEPRMTSVETQLYPILKTGSIDVSGGHHDAGDYSKYTINSAQLVHSLIFSVDAFAGVAAIDNLGLPESGDGVSDLMQEAKIEADFLAKMQDDDGGFFFLVYPKYRKYENNVLPDQGDQQVVWPKNTAVTAAAVGALADIGSSPLFKQHYPAEAAMYLQKAQAGWNFLLNAIATHGKAGSYQYITHYGAVFGHDDELAWAAASMFAATGDPVCQQKLIEWYEPSAGATKRWGWWELFEGYGCAARSYGFAVRTGRRTAAEMNPVQLAKTEAALISAGDKSASWTAKGAYGTPLDESSKRQGVAGWFFSNSWGFNATVASQLQPSVSYRDSVFANTNYEFGSNPLNLSYLTGAGVRQQRELVHQYAQNDHRVLPPSGIPIGNIQAGFPWLANYGSDLGQLGFPSDSASVGRYPFYDRWGDTYNTTTEFVVSQQGRSLGSLAAWAAAANGAAQPWKPLEATINIPAGYLPAGQPVTVSVSHPGLDLSEARVTWEAGDQEPWIGGSQYTFTPTKVTSQWIEAEVLLPDGRRFSASGTFGVCSSAGAEAHALEASTVALYRFDGDYQDSSGNSFHLSKYGRTSLVDQAAGWMAAPSGKAVRFRDIGDKLTVAIPDAYLSPSAAPTPLVIEAWICPLAYKAYGKSNDPVVAISQGWNSRLGIYQDMWLKPSCPTVAADTSTFATNAQWNAAVKPGTWQHLKIMRKADGGFEFWLDSVLLASAPASGVNGGTGDWTLVLGNFDGLLDDVRISAGPFSTPPVANNGGGGSSSPGGSGNNSAVAPAPLPTGPPAGAVISPFKNAWVTDTDTVALYHFDGDFNDGSGNGFHLVPGGNATTVTSYSASGAVKGGVARLSTYGDSLTAVIPDSMIAPGPSDITLEAWIYPRAYLGYGVEDVRLLSLYQSWNSQFSINQDKLALPAAPYLMSGAYMIMDQTEWEASIQPGKWQHLRFTRTAAGVVSIWLDDVLVKTAEVPNADQRTENWTFRIGDIDADIDDVRISRVIRQPAPSEEYVSDANTIALYHFNGNFDDSGPYGLHLNPLGGVTRTGSVEWMNRPTGQAVRFTKMGDALTAVIPDYMLSPGSTATPLTVEARVLIRAYKGYGVGGGGILQLTQNWDSSLMVIQDKWLTPKAPILMAGSKTVVTNTLWNSSVPLGVWQDLKITRDTQSNVRMWLDNVCIAEMNSVVAYGRTNEWTFRMGDIDADFDEVRISNIVR